MKYWPILAMILTAIGSNFAAYLDLKDDISKLSTEIAVVSTKIDTHRHDDKVATVPSVAPPSPSKSLLAPRTAPTRKWSPTFVASRQSFCKKRCGGTDEKCLTDCANKYSACGISNRADPADAKFQRCVSNIPKMVRHPL